MKKHKITSLLVEDLDHSQWTAVDSGLWGKLLKRRGDGALEFRRVGLCSWVESRTGCKFKWFYGWIISLIFRAVVKADQRAAQSKLGRILEDRA